MASNLSAHATWSALDLTMDETPSRRMPSALQVEETATEILLIDDHRRGTCDNEMDGPEVIIGMKVGLESVHSNIGDVEWDFPRNDSVDKVKT